MVLMAGRDGGQEGLNIIRIDYLLHSEMHTKAECKCISRLIVCSTTVALLPKTSTLWPSSLYVTLVPVKSAICWRKGS